MQKIRRIIRVIALFFLKLPNKVFTHKAGFILLGISSTVWFLIRVIPKPQRANYPCMQAAAPMMSGFSSCLPANKGKYTTVKVLVGRNLSCSNPSLLCTICYTK
jgi:hypothetical protein